MESYKIRLQVDAETPEEAIKAAIRLLEGKEGVMLVEHLGTYHPDGVVRECTVPPVGYSLLAVCSEYYGSHSEYGEGDEILFFAIPEGSQEPELHLSHGHFSRHHGDLAKMPAGTLTWDGASWEVFEPSMYEEEARKEEEYRAQL